MADTATLIFSRSDVERLLTLDECIAAVEDAFAQHAQGKTSPPGVLGMHAEDGGFHIKAALLTLDRPYFAAKTNGNFAQNGARHGLPTIQGVVVLCDASNGLPLAVMDSISITALRTAAATAVAAKYLSRKDCDAALVCGCGTQGAMQLRALCRVRSRSASKLTIRTRAKPPSLLRICRQSSVSPSSRRTISQRPSRAAISSLRARPRNVFYHSRHGASRHVHRRGRRRQSGKAGNRSAVAGAAHRHRQTYSINAARSATCTTRSTQR